jgi:hypothetical protein
LGRSRNKVAVPEGAAGSPPFWRLASCIARAVRARGSREHPSEPLAIRCVGPRTSAWGFLPDELSSSSNRGEMTRPQDPASHRAPRAALRERASHTLGRTPTSSEPPAPRAGRPNILVFPAILENSIASASNLYGKYQRAHGGCLGTESR